MRERKEKEVDVGGDEPTGRKAVRPKGTESRGEGGGGEGNVEELKGL